MRAAALALVAAIQLPQFHTGVDLVTVHATVTDRGGRMVSHLAQSTFEILEDGQPQRIEQFDASPLPLALAIALDTSASMRGERFSYARQAIADLITHLTPDDEFSISAFNDRPYAVLPWTNSRSWAAMAMSSVSPVRVGGYTSLYDAVDAALGSLASPRARRRAVLVISDGNDELAGDRMFQDDAHALSRNLSAAARLVPVAEHVGRSEHLVYAIGIESAATKRRLPLDTHALRSLTDPSGGFTETVESNAEVPGAVGRVLDELRHQYLIAYAPAHAPDGKVHRIDVRVHDCTCRVRARTGYVHTRSSVS